MNFLECYSTTTLLVTCYIANISYMSSWAPIHIYIHSPTLCVLGSWTLYIGTPVSSRGRLQICKLQFRPLKMLTFGNSLGLRGFLHYASSWVCPKFSVCQSRWSGPLFKCVCKSLFLEQVRSSRLAQGEERLFCNWTILSLLIQRYALELL